MLDTHNGRVAVYLDFDNIVLSWYDRVHGRNSFSRDRQRIAEGDRDPEIVARLDAAIVNVGAIIDYASSFGTLVLTRAYADWSAPMNAEYRSQLVARAVDLVQLFPAAAYAKNGADIRLAVDAVEDMFRLEDLTHVIIVAGDSDYVPLAQRCKRLGRYVVGIGVAGSTAKSLAAACDEFATYDSLPGVSVPQVAAANEPRGRGGQGSRRGSGARGEGAVGEGAAREQGAGSGQSSGNEHASDGEQTAAAGQGSGGKRGSGAGSDGSAGAPSAGGASGGAEPAAGKGAGDDTGTGTGRGSGRKQGGQTGSGGRGESGRGASSRGSGGRSSGAGGDHDAEPAHALLDDDIDIDSVDSESPEEAALAVTGLLIRALWLSPDTDDSGWLYSSAVKQQMRRMDPSFNEKALGFRTFSDFLRSRSDVVELEESGHERLVRLADQSDN